MCAALPPLGAGIGIGAAERIAAGGIEPIVGRVGDDALLAVLAEQRDRVLIGEEHHFGISALAEQDRCGRGIAVGNEVERALHRAEIARAVGGDGEPRRAGSGGAALVVNRHALAASGRHSRRSRF